MKRVTVACVSLLAVLGIIAGSRTEIGGSSLGASSADGQTEAAQDTEASAQETNPNIPEIDTSVQIMPGASVAVVSKSAKGQFWELVEKGMEAAVGDVNEAYGFEKEEQVTMTFEGADDELDVETQINTIDAVIAENPAALCISASDMDSCLAQLESARENDIPVIAFDSGVSNSELVRAYRGSDNQKIGEIGARKLAGAIEEKGKVAVFSAQEKTQSSRERVRGFQEKIAEYPEIEVVQVIYEDQVNDLAAAMTGVLEIYPDLAGVFCTNADTSEMYLNLEKDAEKASIAVVGVDATSRQQQAVRDGEEIGVVSQQPYAMGYQTIWAALQATAPEGSAGPEQSILIEPGWIDSENIDDPAVSDYIYQS